MGVLACNRRGCRNIMCDRYSHEHGYICRECFNELVSLGVDTNVAEFMDSQKKEVHEPPRVDPYDYFDKIFPDPKEW